MSINILSELEKRKELVARRSGYIELENYHAGWTPEEMDSMGKMFYDGIGISEIAIRLGRSEIAIFQKLNSEELFRRIRKPNGTHAVPTCKCSKCKLQTQCKNGGGQCTNKSEMEEIEHEQAE